MFTEAYFEPSQRSAMELFSLFDRIAFRFRFLHNSPFREKTYNCENFGRKILLLTIEQYFFSKFKITRWNGVINKEGFLN